MATEPELSQNRIVHDPAIMAGKPVVKGTRIPVERVIAHLAHNPELDDLYEAYPELTIEDVKACLHYAHTVLGKQRLRTKRRSSKTLRRAPA